MIIKIKSWLLFLRGLDWRKFFNIYLETNREGFKKTNWSEWLA